MKDLSRRLALSRSAADDVAPMSLTCASNPQDCGTFAEPPPFRKTRSGADVERVEKDCFIVGRVGALYGAMSHVNFWLMHAGLCAGSTVAILLLYRPPRKALTPDATGSGVATHA
jgi:hypothetical protein